MGGEEEGEGEEEKEGGEGREGEKRVEKRKGNSLDLEETRNSRGHIFGSIYFISVSE